MTCPSCGRENAPEARFCSACGAALTGAPAAAEVRKTVTVVFTDVTESTALGERLDPETMRRIMVRYFDEMQAVVDRHGGTVEKFIGDAVMAVFGIPQLHEDDAFRAVRAAAEMRERLRTLNEELESDFGARLQIRTGVNTGEVVAGTGQTIATGDAVNVAARLEQAAGPGEILIGDTTYRLVRDAVDAEPTEPLEAKGKRAPLTVHRLERVIEGAEPFARRLESPLVGRKRELALLHDAYRRVVDEQSCHLFTILGTAGIGKSRLAQELLATVEDEATILSGRCLPYGDGITYWPLFEILQQLGSEATIVQLLEATPDARALVNQVFGAAGLADPAGAGEEIFWAIRKLFEALARERPLVLVFDDVHWAETTFLDLLEHVADLSREAPILLTCLARPELLDQRAGWAGGKLNATSILLEPLSEDAADRLIENLLAETGLHRDIHDRVAEAAEGNPLFVEQLVAMLAEETSTNGEVDIPPTIQALIAARLDRLPSDERAVIERAAIIGKEFWRNAVDELAPELGETTRPLQQLVRKELVRPFRSSVLPAEDAFRFRHLLIRDVAYGGIPKDLRAELHERFADWVTQQRSGYEEIVGYHFEQAYSYRTELGPADERTRALAARAAELLGYAGRRALMRGDAGAALSLLDRAASMLPVESAERLELQVDLGRAFWEAGVLDRASDVLSDAVDRAQVSEEPLVAARASAYRLDVAANSGSITMDEAMIEAKRVLAVFEAAGDDGGLAQAWALIAKFSFWLGRSAEAVQGWERAALHARQAGDRRGEADALIWLAVETMSGPTPADEALRRVEGLLERSAEQPQVAAVALVARGVLRAMQGGFDEGRGDVIRGRGLLEDLGSRLTWAATSTPATMLEWLAGDEVAAEAAARAGIEALREMGERGYFSTIAGHLAESLCRQGRFDEADHFSRLSEEAAAADDLDSQARWRAARAQVLASQGRFDEAETLAREAVALVEPSDWLDQRGDMLLSLAEVLRLAGKAAEAARAVDEAVRLFDRRGNTVSAQRARALGDELDARVP
jgi:class 3 adenylate cyclase/tetratricopeptide (TPR) repeat protein